MLNFGNVQGDSPVSQDFIWMAEYADGNALSEFDLNTKQENSFYTIDKSITTRFGLIGHGMKLYFETIGGYFKLAGLQVEVIYRTDDRDYYLTGQQLMYNDIITYKDAESVANLRSGTEFSTRINQFNFGYKQTLMIDDVTFNFKPICKIPYNQPAFMNFSLVADKDLNGKLVIRKNGFEVQEFDAPLKQGVGGELNWIIS